MHFARRENSCLHFARGQNSCLHFARGGNKGLHFARMENSCLHFARGENSCLHFARIRMSTFAHPEDTVMKLGLPDEQPRLLDEHLCSFGRPSFATVWEPFLDAGREPFWIWEGSCFGSGKGAVVDPGREPFWKKGKQLLAFC